MTAPGRSQTYEKHSGGALRQGADSPREPSSRLPHDVLRALLLMCLRGSLHADAGVRTGVVVEGNEAGYALQRVLVRLEALLAVADSEDGDLEGAGFHYGLNASGYLTSDIWLMRTDADGNILWSRCYGGSEHESVSRIFRNEDGGFMESKKKI